MPYETLRSPVNAGYETSLSVTRTQAREELRSSPSGDENEVMVDATSAQWMRENTISPPCTLLGTQAIVGYAVVGCCRVGLDFGIRS
jgi:hypothetical protein